MRRVFVFAVVLGCQSASAQDQSLEYGMSDAQRVQVNGTTITYIERGAGLPLLLVHGAFADFRYWQPVIDSLAESYRVVAYSRRDSIRTRCTIHRLPTHTLTAMIWLHSSRD